MNKPTRSDDILQGASDAIYYEWQMFVRTLLGIGSGIAAFSKMQSALIESWVIHLRNLMEFLYPSKAVHPDTIIASHFFPDGRWEELRPDESSYLAEQGQRAHEEVAHVTYNRIPKIRGEEKKNWDIEKLYLEILEPWEVFEHNLPEHLYGDRWKKAPPPKLTFIFTDDISQ